MNHIEELSEEELAQVSGGKKEAEEEEYLYRFEIDDWVYAKADQTVIHRVTKTVRKNSRLYPVPVEVSAEGMQSVSVRVQAEVLLQNYHLYGGKLTHYS